MRHRPSSAASILALDRRQPHRRDFRRGKYAIKGYYRIIPIFIMIVRHAEARARVLGRALIDAAASPAPLIDAQPSRKKIAEISLLKCGKHRLSGDVTSTS